ncbi:D-2-hydroxyacid dehydrogenase [Salinigranum rubrum]|uniref:D-2-hydroxyacid dehydrogenase n=1 Tax=Salinigranum rubrum TaxID=755307 RepID=A0A2I8VML4_9EURY|nr:D-2-hydroxyacid dehydrogenase [Salinigranum rubrum]AUV83158.1 D-2-hydroxyacid dehydrogenase [Salinigranum rubrum]
MELERVVVHDSVEIIFDPGVLVEALSDLPLPVESPDDPDLGAGDAVVAFGPHPSFLDASWVHCIRAGYDEFPIDRYADAGVVLTNSTGIHGTAIGESVLGYMLTFARGLHTFRDRQRAREWEREPYETLFTLDDERVCVVGLGTLGSGVAERASALGMDVVGVRQSGAAHEHARRVHTPDALGEAVSGARFVVLTLPLTEETEGLVSRATFDAMDDESYLINVARGAIVDTDALVTALDDGVIAGAALDVFEREPLPETSPLWEDDDVIVTPHTSGVSRRYHEDVATLVRTNVRRIRAGEDLTNRVV